MIEETPKRYAGDDGRGAWPIATSFPVLDTPGMNPPQTYGGAPTAPATPASVLAFDPSQYSYFTIIAGTIGLVAVNVLPEPATYRTFLLIVNPDPAKILYVGFGITPSATNQLPIAPNYGSLLLDERVSQDDIWIVGSAAATPYVITYSNTTPFG